MNKIGRLFSGIFVVSALWAQVPVFGMSAKDRLQQKIASKNRVLEELCKEANKLFFEHKFLHSFVEFIEANICLVDADKKQEEAFGDKRFHIKGNVYILFEKPKQIAFLLQHMAMINVDFLSQHPEFIKTMEQSPDPDILAMLSVAKSIVNIMQCIKILEEKFDNFDKQRTKILSLHSFMKFPKDSLFVQIFGFMEECENLVKQRGFNSSIEEEYLNHGGSLSKKIKEAFASKNEEYVSIIKNIKERMGGIASGKYLKKLDESGELLPSSLLSNVLGSSSTKSIQNEQEYVVVSSSSSSYNVPLSRKREKAEKARRLSTDRLQDKYDERLNVPEIKSVATALLASGVSSSSSSSLIPLNPAALKLPSKLSTDDGSQVVADNEYYITIQDKNGAKYLFYKPEADKKITFDEPEFSYDERVKKYLHDSEQAMEEESRFSDIKSAEVLQKIKLLKAFPHAADWLIKSLGIAGEYCDDQGRKIPNVTLMGQIQPKHDLKLVNCIFQWGFDPKNSNFCYHRSATEKIPEDMIKEYQARKFNVDFPPLPSS